MKIVYRYLACMKTFDHRHLRSCLRTPLCFTNCPIPMLSLTRLMSLLMILSLASCLDADRTYYFCPDDCNFELGYGYCQVRRGEVMRFTSHSHLIRCPLTQYLKTFKQEDGTCLCSSGRTGVDCSSVCSVLFAWLNPT